MTLVEVLTVFGIIIILLAILLPALSVARQNSLWAGSQNNLRQVFTMMRGYTTDNREFLVPSQFDYSTSPFPGKVRSASPDSATPPVGDLHQGTWTDILWTTGELGPIASVAENPAVWNYRYDSPDQALYDILPDFADNPFRSLASNTRQITTGTGIATPFGEGAHEAGEPGYFAANDFFNARADDGGQWWTTGQIKQPSNSVVLVDSYMGEVIPAEDEAWDSTDPSSLTSELDFRYVGDNILMLMVDGRLVTEPRWGTLNELGTKRQIRVKNLNQ